MFGTGQAVARARYAQVDLGSKVEGASPHRLIGILFEELLKTLDTMAVMLDRADMAAASGLRVALSRRRAHAASILMGLEASLDHGKGGNLSAELAAVYREARRLLGEGTTALDADPIVRAREMIAEIAEAWDAIG